MTIEVKQYIIIIMIFNDSCYIPVANVADRIMIKLSFTTSVSDADNLPICVLNVVSAPLALPPLLLMASGEEEEKLSISSLL